MVFNEKDGEFSATITQLEKRHGTLTIHKQARPAYIPPELHLIFCPVKNTKTEWIIEKATELGVTHIHPVISDHTMVKKTNRERLTFAAISAAEQCKRFDIPTIHPLCTLSQKLKDWSTETTIIHGDETGSGQPIGQLLQDNNIIMPMAALVGPEGGFSQTEVALLASLDYVQSVGLGERILRADTAILSMLSAINMMRGDWYRLPILNP